MEREWWIFWALKVLESGQGNRKLINIVFPGYEPDKDMARFLYIDARDHSDTSRPLPDIAWLDALRRALSLPPDVIRFANDDAGYFWWLERHPQGYVLNTDANPGASVPTLHRATCTTIGKIAAEGREGFPQRNVMTEVYPKVCAGSRADADLWAVQHAGSAAATGCYCNSVVSYTP